MMDMSLPLAIEIGVSKHGRGIFATRDIAIHEEFYQYTGKKIGFKDCEAMGEDQCYPIQINHKNSSQAYILSDAPGCFINHRCNEPNAGLTPTLRLKALRTIKKGEEVFFDYSTTMLERSWVMPCQCSHPECRGVIQDFDLIPSLVQQHFLSHGVVQPFIVQTLNKKPLH